MAQDIQKLKFLGVFYVQEYDRYIKIRIKWIIQTRNKKKLNLKI